MLAYSDEAVWIILVPLLAYSASTSIVLQVRVGSKSSQQQINDFVFQAAVPKVIIKSRQDTNIASETIRHKL